MLIRREPSGTNEILIMDNPDPELCDKKYGGGDMGGLGYLAIIVVGAANLAREYDSCL